MIENVLKLAENESNGVLELARSIGGIYFVDMSIEDIQGLLVEAEIYEVDMGK